MKINYKNVNTNKLHDELISYGIIPLLVESLGEDTWVTYKDNEDMTKVEVIVAAHDPKPLPPTPTEDDYMLDLDYRLSKIELGL